ncbi:NAD(P)-dependent oxidoreductase [Formicincola oecophyllae]|uniref:NAD(P)-dependent oxidoreductase n=1 Tax=Formicincola oecophyllae TaxID=2558361 RepID=A0A4Y6U8F8_9PROT|nr:NAD-dependent epimerase/dehydratase family protein [Formicincola oecophyllae]QDH12858.1 NAD(P)-dependent oxidoreductase [Formicincola oecophyllae]
MTAATSTPTVLVAGASGALGRPLLKRLLASGCAVWGLARRPESVERIKALGAQALRCDVLDGADVQKAFAAIRPTAVVDFLSSLPHSPAGLAAALPGDARLRLDGGANLLAAAQHVGTMHYLRQSSGFYLAAPKGQLATESSGFRVDGPGSVGQSSRMYHQQEQRLRAAPLNTTALRFGFIYGPGTWYTQDGVVAQAFKAGQMPLIGAADGVWSFVDVEDAATATQAALMRSLAKGGSALHEVYDLTDATPQLYGEWARDFARWVGAPVPASLPPAEGEKACGVEMAYCENQLSGAANSKACTELAFNPSPEPWLG